jgi:hypothetical protein
MRSPGVCMLAAANSSPTTSRYATPAHSPPRRHRDVSAGRCQATARRTVRVPRLRPFLVKKSSPEWTTMPQPTTSPVVTVSPYSSPSLPKQNLRPPRTAHDDGDDPSCELQSKPSETTPTATLLRAAHHAPTSQQRRRQQQTRCAARRQAQHQHVTHATRHAATSSNSAAAAASHATPRRRGRRGRNAMRR